MFKIKDKNGQNHSIILFIFLFIFGINILSSFIFSVITNIKDRNKIADGDIGEYKVYGGFDINKYDVVLNVSEDNIVDVEETISVKWTEEGHHGIYRFVPEWLEYTDKNGKTIKRKSIVEDLESTDEYAVDVVKKKKRIKIGSAAQTVSGYKDYVITYRYDMGSDPFQNGDEFIFHAFGDYWGAVIQNYSVTINMPKEIDPSEIYLFKDKYRKEEIDNAYVTYTEDHKTININCYNCNLDRALTIEIPLEEGYFEGGSSNYGKGSLIVSMICIITAIVTFLLWLKFGKDYDKEVETIEFTSPDNLDPAEIGYIVGHQTGRKLVAALLVSLVSKGYIKIDYTDEKKKDYTFQNLLYYEEKSHVMEVSLIKSADSGLTVEEAKYMKELFEKSLDNVEVFNDNCNLLKTKYGNLITKGYIKVNKDEDVTKTSIEYQLNATKLPKLSQAEEILYKRLFPNGEIETSAKTNADLYKVFSEVSTYLEGNFNPKLEEQVGKHLKPTFTIIGIILVWLSYKSYVNIEDMNPKIGFLYYFSFLASFITIFFGLLMPRRTKYGELITARVKGFKNYLLTAEKDQLEAQVENNPYYFFDILPYAYALHVSKKWVKKFENMNIQFPESASGVDYLDVGSFDNFTSDMNPPSSSGSGCGSSGCSSCGGGCSSCGGGCSSCGGGGSW